MAKSIVVELKESWVLSRQNDEVLPIARLCAFLEDKLGEKVSFADSSFSYVKIVLTNEELYQKLSQRNIDKAKEYEDSVLSQRRSEFYQKLRELLD